MAVLHRARLAIGMLAAVLLTRIVTGGQMATADRLGSELTPHRALN
jgi:hypothetical protein